MKKQYVIQLLITLIGLAIYFTTYLAPTMLSVTVIILADLALITIATIINVNFKS